MVAWEKKLKCAYVRHGLLFVCVCACVCVWGVQVTESDLMMKRLFVKVFFVQLVALLHHLFNIFSEWKLLSSWFMWTPEDIINNNNNMDEYRQNRISVKSLNNPKIAKFWMLLVPLWSSKGLKLNSYIFIGKKNQ